MFSFKSVVLVALLVLSCSAGQAGTGTLQITVADTQGAPLPGAEVQYRRLHVTVFDNVRRIVPAPGEAVVSGALSTDRNGSLTLSSLPAGDYALCASVPSLPYLDPCKWSTGPRVSIKANATTTYTLKLTKGVFLNVRVSDPAHLLPAVKDTPLSAANLIVGVKFGNGAYLGAQNTGVDTTGRSYQMVVPAGMPLRLWLFSRHVELSDTGGNAVDMTGGMLPFQPTTGVDPTFTFAVTGVLGQTH